MEIALRKASSRLCLVSAVLIGLSVAVPADANQAGIPAADQAGRLSVLSQDPAVLPKIDRRPKAADFRRGLLRSLPKPHPNSTNPFEVDLRGYDLSALDLASAGDDLSYASFDDRTVWPAPDHMPAGFEPQQILETGKNPGLGVRALHAQGIRGRGVGIAIIDNPLLVDHVEYADRLRFYEENNVLPWQAAHMHGPAVASIAVGKTTGVAPEADLYYIGLWHMDLLGAAFGREPPLNFAYGARAIHRILEINEQLPEDRKIRVISMSIGWSRSQKGYQEITDAAQKAKAAGMLVICSSVEEVHGFRFHGLGRDLARDPDDPNSYRLASWGRNLSAGNARLLVPMDARTTASPTGKAEYVFYGQGGWSWTIPYLAGIYALVVEVDPKITPERFWALALKTGRTIETTDAGKPISLGPILNPAELIEAVRRGDLSDKAAVAAELAKYPGSASRDRTPFWDSKGRMPQELAARIARLDIDRASRKDVIEQLGQPVSYRRGSEVLDPDNLPSRYAILYEAGFHAIISDDRVQALVFSLPGYLWRDKIEVGTPAQDVFQVVGLPSETIENARTAQIAQSQPGDGILYKDIDGVEGVCYLHLPSQGVSLYFTDNRVRQMTLLPKGR